MCCRVRRGGPADVPGLAGVCHLTHGLRGQGRSHRCSLPLLPQTPQIVWCYSVPEIHFGKGTEARTLNNILKTCRPGHIWAGADECGAERRRIRARPPRSSAAAAAAGRVGRTRSRRLPTQPRHPLPCLPGVSSVLQSPEPDPSFLDIKRPKKYRP